MKHLVSSPEAYLSELTEARKTSMQKLRTVIKTNLPKGFTEVINYGMIGYVVPHTLYPQGYHCNPKLPLPFINLASQKQFIALYHMGLYAKPDLLNWFTNTYVNQFHSKPDMGKSCIRFKKMELIPYDLISQLCKKMTVEEWVEVYERNFKPKSKK